MNNVEYIEKAIDSTRRKRALWKRVQRRRNAWENKFAFLFRQILNNQYNELALRMTADNLRSESLINTVITKEPIETGILQLYKAVGSDFAQSQENELKSLDIKETDKWYGLLTNYVKRRLWKRIQAINQETIKQAGKTINKYLEQSVEEGLGAEETARAVRKGLLTEGIELNQWRALRIARTEIVSASNIGSLEAAKASGEDLEKYWIATYDERTRDTHRTVEEQNPKQFDEGFRVGEYLMECPGDPDAGPEETINCRCSITFKPRGYNSEEFYRSL
jgi:hypothetical protein